MRKSYFNAKNLALAILCHITMFAAHTVNGKTVEVSTLAKLQEALRDTDVSEVIITSTIELTDNTYLCANSLADGSRKIVRVRDPFLPDDGKVTIKASTTGGLKDTLESPTEAEYSKYNLFDIKADSSVVISNLTLKGGFKGGRTASDDATTGGIDNSGHLVMYETDITQTGTALLNRPKATAVLVDCNIVRNANWYGGGILNFAQRNDNGDYINGGTLIMDRCSLTENESLGPQHGGGAAENQGYMYLNNCVVANNASTEIGGGINNCKGGELYVMNSTFTGNITTSKDYGATAGGAIGNAGGAGSVYIVNSILAYNGYDTGSYVNNVSLGRYQGSTTPHACEIINTAIDATAGMDRLDSTNLVVRSDGLFTGLSDSGIVAAGGNHVENGVSYSSSFTHPLVPNSDHEYRYAPEMMSIETNHYAFALAVDTYFDYSEILEGKSYIPYMGYDNGEEIVKLGSSEHVRTPDAGMLVTVTFSGESRTPDENGIKRNAMGAATVKPNIQIETPPQPGVFTVKLGQFTGGKVSGVTVYGDSYISNSLITVHAIPSSAHYLNGWMVNDVVISNTAQQLIYSFLVVTNLTITPIFHPVITQVIRARQRYPWNNLVDIDYAVAETNAVRYRLVFFATYEDNGTNCTVQLKSFRKNANVQETQTLGQRIDLHREGDHRVTWDSAADGINLKGKTIHFKALACEGDER